MEFTSHIALFIWEVAVNVHDLDTIDADSVSIKAVRGNVNEGEIRKIVGKSTKGVEFIKDFIRNMLSYIRAVEQRAKFRNNHI